MACPWGAQRTCGVLVGQARTAVSTTVSSRFDIAKGSTGVLIGWMIIYMHGLVVVAPRPTHKEVHGIGLRVARWQSVVTCCRAEWIHISQECCVWGTICLRKCRSLSLPERPCISFMMVQGAGGVILNLNMFHRTINMV